MTGPGYQAGDWEIHPGIAGEIGYDSNYFLRSDKTDPRYVNAAPQLPPEGTGLFRITPSIIFRSFATGQRAEVGQRGAPPLILSGGAAGTYSEYFSGAVQSQRNMNLNGDVALGINPGHPVSGSLAVNYVRIIQPTVFGSPDLSYNNDTLIGTADLATQPGLGTLDWHFGYQFTGIFFEDSGGIPYNNVMHTGYTRGRWRFRPRTAILYDGSISTRSYTTQRPTEFSLHTTTPIRVNFGIEGLLTPRMSLLVMAGYAGLFSSKLSANDPSQQQFDSFTGNAELRFFPQQAQSDAPGSATLMVSNIAIGYQRQMQASYLNDFFTADRGYLRAMYAFAGRAVVSFEGGVGALEHPDLYFGSQVAGGAPVLMHTAYTDVRADASLFGEYRIVPSVGINATLNYTETFSTVALPVTTVDVNNPNGQFYDQSWRRFQAFLGVRWMM